MDGFSRFRLAVARKNAWLWHHLDVARYRYLVWQHLHGQVTILSVLVVAIVGSAFFVPTLQNLMQQGFGSDAKLAALGSLFLGLGVALVGATAIVSSLVLFSMQVNIERMPHGLFRQLSADPFLLSIFAVSFLLALGVAILSLVAQQNTIGLTTFVAFWSTTVVIVLFVCGYRRALILVNPTQQLALVVRKTQKELRTWARRAKRAAPLFSEDSGTPTIEDERSASQHDVKRVTYFQVNPHWTSGALQGMQYAFSFARRYAEQGDHEVSAAAMDAVIAINRSYIEAKGRTFFGELWLIENPLSSDGVVNETLEHIRQTAQISIARKDEQQIQQCFHTLSALVREYLTIDYAGPVESRTHAHLAAGYLANEVQRVVAHQMPDILMEGIRQMGLCADMILTVEGPQGTRFLVERIGTIGCVGIPRDQLRPVTHSAVDQLARISFNLLRCREPEVHFAAEDVRESVKLIANRLIDQPDTPLSSIHSRYLAPYYSASSTQSLTAKLTKLANAISDAPEDDEDSQQIVDNLDEWAEGMHETDREIFLHAIAQRSQFTFDMIRWIASTTTILLAVSNTDACSDHNKQKLRDHAKWLIAVLDWVPVDQESIKFVERFRLTETLFKSAIDARNRDCDSIADFIANLLISWMFKGANHHTGRAILERAIYGIAALVVHHDNGDFGQILKAEISRRLAEGELPNQEVRTHAARDIRDRAAALYRQGSHFSAIDSAIAALDHQKLRPLLEDLADLISPTPDGGTV